MKYLIALVATLTFAALAMANPMEPAVVPEPIEQTDSGFFWDDAMPELPVIEDTDGSVAGYLWETRDKTVEDEPVQVADYLWDQRKYW